MKSCGPDGNSSLTLRRLPLTRRRWTVDQMGIGPTTSSMRMKRSTDELLALTDVILSKNKVKLT